MALLPPLLPTKQSPRGDFQPMEFRRLFAQLGQPVTWEMTAVCPCGQQLNEVAESFSASHVLGRLAVSGEPKTICATCGGKGWYKHSSQPITVIVQDMAVNPRRFGVTGEYAVGRAHISFLPENKPGLGDRIVLTTSVHRVHEFVTRTAGATQALRFPIVAQVQETATGNQTIRVLQAKKAANNVASADLVEGAAFTVDGQGRLVWNDLAGAPAVDDAFSITYYARPRYVIEDVPFAVRDTIVHHKTVSPKDTRLPIYAIARQEYRGDGVNRGY
jgi:hypothetical protein